MTEQQRKIIGLLLLASALSVVEILAIGSTLTDYIGGDPTPGMTGSFMRRTINTPFGSFYGGWISHEQFEFYRIAIPVLISILQIVLVYKAVKTVRNTH